MENTETGEKFMPTLTALSQITSYIPVPVISTLLGAIVGGAISFININRQFKEQRKRDIAQDRKNELIAVNSVAKEIEYNCLQLLNYQKYMIKNGLIEHNFKATNTPLLLKQDKWIKHSDIIEFTQEIEKVLSDLQYFYYLMSHYIGNQTLSQKNMDNALEKGASLIKFMEEFVKEQRNQNKRS